MKPGSTWRRTTIFLLAAAVVVVVVRSRGGAAAATDDGDAIRAELERRVARYIELREAGNWPTLYELADPWQRRRVDLVRFLDAYGHGVMDVQSMDALAIRYDPSLDAAVVDLHTEAVLVVERLPATFRRSLKEDHPEHLRQALDHSLTWVRRDGQWYYLLDKEIVTGVDAEGHPLQGIGAVQG